METCYNDACLQHDKGDKCLALAVCDSLVATFNKGLVECRTESCSAYNDGDLYDEDLVGCPNRTTGTAPVDDACRAGCINAKCEFHEEEDDTCLQLKPCGSLIAPARPAIRVDLLQGYTLEQWVAVIKGGYLCQFSSDGKNWGPFVGPLDEIEDELFICELRERWNYCRPAQIPGVLRPWFGGECPVAPDAMVFVKFRDGGHDTTTANNLECPVADDAPVFVKYRGGESNVLHAGLALWGRGPRPAPVLITDAEIIAYMEV